MRKSHLLAAVAAVVVVAGSLLSMTLSGSDAAAQSPVRSPLQQQTAPPVVALLDTTYIFKNHARMKARMDNLKKRVDAAEAWVKQEREAILKLRDELKQWRAGSPEYKAQEEAIAKRQTGLALKVSHQKREFLQEEARIYLDVYREIQQEVNYYCQAKGITMVLRFSREAPDPEKPDTVLAYIHKPVVTYANHLDITNLILNQLNGPAPGGNPSPIGTRQRPGVPFKR